jgi:hypothetical protein
MHDQSIIVGYVVDVGLTEKFDLNGETISRTKYILEWLVGRADGVPVLDVDVYLLPEVLPDVELYCLAYGIVSASRFVMASCCSSLRGLNGIQF